MNIDKLFARNIIERYEVQVINFIQKADEIIQNDITN